MTYYVYKGGTCNDIKDGICKSNYIKGEQINSFKINGAVNSIGRSSDMGRMMR